MIQIAFRGARATGAGVAGSNPHRMVRPARCLRSAIRFAMPLGLALAAACTASSEEVRPPGDQFFFPTGVAVTPDESTLFVLSANSELRYDSGTISVIDLGHVDDIVDAWLTGGTVPSGCDVDTSFSETIECDEASFLSTDAAVRIGNFATNIAMQDKGGGDLRLVIPVRGDPSVTWVDWDGASKSLSCGGGEGFELCSDANRLTKFESVQDEDVQISEEPYGAFVDSAGQWAVITHLTSGTATLVDLAGTPALSDNLTGLFAADRFGRRGSIGVAGRTPGQPDDLVYVTSSSENRVQTFAIARTGEDDRPRLLPSEYFFLDRVGANGGGSSDTRAVAFSADGSRGYFMNRLPPSLAVVDTSLAPDGFPTNQVIGATDICREGSSLAVSDVGEGERAFISCFQSGQLYVVDPSADVHVEAIAPVGRGPFSVAVAPGRKRLYVSNFYENTVAVVDLTPGSVTQYRTVLRIGLPSDP